jgi:hypothetical protein
MRPTRLGHALGALALAPACASTDDVVEPTTPGGTTHVGTGGAATTTAAGGAGGTASTSTSTTTTTTGTGGAAGAGGSTATGCASGLLCGQGACCAAGEECVSGACVPACDSHVRCGKGGATCCDAAELCLGDACVVPTTKCGDSFDCKEHERCEPTLGKCVPDAPGAPACELHPAPGALSPTLAWSWTGSAIKPTADQVVNVPLVVDLENDGEPEVVVVTSTDFASNHSGYLRALRGKDGTEIWPDSAGVYAAGNQVNPRGTPAAADLDGDGKIEIVAPKMGGGLIAFRADGSLLWTSTQKDGKTAWTTSIASAAVAIGDVDDDGKPEVVVGGSVFDHAGRLVDDIVSNAAFAGSHDTSFGAVSILADIDANGTLEVVTGNAAYALEQGVLVPVWQNGQTDGYPAIADLDLDGAPELVVVSKGTVRVHDATTGVVKATLAFPAGVGGAGGPPTIADLDGDGKPDIGTAGSKGYLAFGYVGGAKPAITLLWQTATQDSSSNRTGSSAFDFHGDGSSEIVYGDECTLRVYAGKDGAVLFETPSSSATIHEYPVVADVDADGRTELVVVSNDANHVGPTPSITCPGYGPKDAPRHGVFVYGDAHHAWPRTRRLWNEHASHVTNVRSDGSIPHPEPASFVTPAGRNDYRRSSERAGLFDAPNLTVSLAAGLGACPGALRLEATVANEGSSGVPAGVDVTFFVGASPKGAKIATVKTKGALLPGHTEAVSFDYALGQGAPPAAYSVVVDGEVAAPGAVVECVEDDNDASVAGALCPAAK